MLFRKKVDRFCTYCEYAGKISDEQMICQKYGIVPVCALAHIAMNASETIMIVLFISSELI